MHKIKLIKLNRLNQICSQPCETQHFVCSDGRDIVSGNYYQQREPSYVESGKFAAAFSQLESAHVIAGIKAVILNLCFPFWQIWMLKKMHDDNMFKVGR